MVQQGKKIAWIARHMNISHGTVYADLQRKQKQISIATLS
ncbi:hypothetical protein P4571_15265 [Niallia alba]|nr:hypothetical protein [Niallia alba]